MKGLIYQALFLTLSITSVLPIKKLLFALLCDSPHVFTKRSPKSLASLFWKVETSSNILDNCLIEMFRVLAVVQRWEAYY
uniref:Uncharacterized protein n=1 Tax=Arundo donax TaxID=35708 RepID=A0A0A8ZYC4_ARUDO